MRLRSRRQAGLTLLELMISVAIIGVLAATAIPAFFQYQARSKRSEAYTNLEGIRKVQITYFTEFGAYVMSASSPRLSLTTDKQNWHFEDDKRFATDVPGAGFEQVGWVPEGATYFDYDVNAAVGANGPYFTAAAYGDVDGDGLVSLFMYVSPDQAGAWLPCYQCPGGPAPVVTWANPPRDAYGNDVFNSVAPVLPPGSDDY